ncbi:hypothetical protein ES332_D07G276600v1 [Gossypium tomentosum]|uniref:Reverse transcriptase zinc-binding domain-containing protein n=3 Tax=Gossypium tomentosum TaxID=34277 RepID=A0A5D2KCK9_GOSTO|nr:hypothetical protein ES332_D07G276600v1 [Gossypium tomentosum]
MDIPDVFAGFVDFIFAIKESISGLQMNNNSKSELFNYGASDSTLLAVADFTVPIRLQLLQSIIFSIMNFWSKILLIPAKVIKDISSICTTFLRKGTDGTAKDAKISLESVCPRIWNKAGIFGNLWTVWIKSGSLCVSWIETYRLKGRDILQLQSSQGQCWYWKTLLQLRSLLPLWWISIFL